MAKVTIQFKNEELLILNDIENFAATGTGVPYWMVERNDATKGEVREFFHFEYVNYIRVEGEAELIQKAKQKLNDSAARRAEDLGVGEG